MCRGSLTGDAQRTLQLSQVAHGCVVGTMLGVKRALKAIWYLTLGHLPEHDDTPLRKLIVSIASLL